MYHNLYEIGKILLIVEQILVIFAAGYFFDKWFLERKPDELDPTDPSNDPVPFNHHA